MGLHKGINCGFVTEAPTGDPGAADIQVSDIQHALKCTVPATAKRVTQIGFYVANATEQSNFEVAIYDHNVGDNNPENVIGKHTVNLKGTTLGWKRRLGLNIAVTPLDVVWIANQLDVTPTPTQTNYADTGGEKYDRVTNRLSLLDPWGVSTHTYETLLAIYAVWDTGPPAEEHECGSIRKDGLQAEVLPGLYE